jgi:hypothetical protein
MKILIIKGSDFHTKFRIVPGFSYYGCNVTVVEKYEDLTGERFDLTFVDPSLDFDPTSRLNTDKLMFYDCEDGPTDFKEGEAYNLLKHKVIAYAKMNWVDEDPRNDGILNIGFPLPCYKNLFKVASTYFPEFNYTNSVPIMFASPTFIGRYTPVDNGIYNSSDDINCLAKHDSNLEDEVMYNQRIDWLLSLRKNNIFHIGGISFSEGNLSYDFQSKYFGKNVNNLSVKRISYGDTIKNAIQYRIGLCPTGHERISWRTFDLMATGSILIWTDNKMQKSMIMPEEYITVYDGEDLGSKLISIQKDYKEIWKSCQKNKQLLNIDNEKVIQIFNNQYV